jgi:ribosome-associated translation inhibitor RaiA
VAIPLQISYRDVAQSDVLEAIIAQETAKLERYFPRVVHCRVLIEHTRGRRPIGAPYRVRIVLTVPGHEFVINQSADDVAVRTAFRKAKRQLQEHARLVAS